MQTFVRFFVISAICILAAFTSCKKDGKQDEFPTLTTNPVTVFDGTTATLGGNITNSGTPKYTERGVCYAITPSPTIDNNRAVVPGSGTGVFSTNVNGLISNTQYYVRSYAINSEFPIYGNQVVFTTKNNLPALTTSAVTVVTDVTATLGGNITNEGTPPYTERGVVISTTSNPTIGGANVRKEIISGTGSGSFSEIISGLTPKTAYFVRAYATNSDDTVYGQQVGFITDEPEPVPEQATFNFETGEWSLGNHESNKCTWDETLLVVNDGANIIISGAVNNGRRIEINGSANVTISNVSIAGLSSNQSPITLANGANLTLTLVGTNRITGGSYSAGIHAPNGTTLTIIGSGSLEATGGNGSNGENQVIGIGAGAGIGGSSLSGGNGGNITINSGTIIAKGGSGDRGGNGIVLNYGYGGGGAGAGIGGGGGNGGSGNNKGDSGGSGGVITINGGIVTAVGGNNGGRGTSGFLLGSGGGGGGRGAGIGGNSGSNTNGNAGETNSEPIGKGANGGEGSNLGNGGDGGGAATFKCNGGTITANGEVKY